MTGKTQEKEMKMKNEIETMFEVFVATPRGEYSFGFVTADTWMDAIPMVEKTWNSLYPNDPFNRDNIRLEYVRTFSKICA